MLAEKPTVFQMAERLKKTEEAVVQMVWERILNPEDFRPMEVRIVLWDVWKHEMRVGEALDEIQKIKQIQQS